MRAAQQAGIAVTLSNSISGFHQTFDDQSTGISQLLLQILQAEGALAGVGSAQGEYLGTGHTRRPCPNTQTQPSAHNLGTRIGRKIVYDRIPRTFGVSSRVGLSYSIPTRSTHGSGNNSAVRTEGETQSSGGSEITSCGSSSSAVTHASLTQAHPNRRRYLLDGSEVMKGRNP